MLHARADGAGRKLLLDAGLTPVFSPLTHDGKGQILNTNADTIASSLASGACPRITRCGWSYCFEKKGVLRNAEDDDSVINLINREIYQAAAGRRRIDRRHPAEAGQRFFAAIESGGKEVLIGHADDVRKEHHRFGSGYLNTANYVESNNVYEDAVKLIKRT